MRLRAKVDANQADIDAALEAMGWLVWPTHQLGKGFPDRVIAKAGRLLLLEVKDGAKSPSRRALTEDEIGCHLQFKAHGVEILVVTCIEDLMQIDRPQEPDYVPTLGDA